MNFKRILIWGGSAIVLIGMVWGLARLASVPPQTGTPGKLSDPVSSTDHRRGNNLAKVTLVEYSDFECPACYNFFSVVDNIYKKYGQDILLVYRHFPLPQHSKSRLAASAAVAAENQGKFWEMHDLLFQNQPNWANLSPAEAEKRFTDYAIQLGLEKEKFAADLVSASTAAVIDKNLESGKKSNVDSTPTFYINGDKVTTLQTYGDLETAIANAIAKNK